MSVYHLCYCLQSLLSLLRNITSFSTVQKRHSKVYGKPNTPSFYSILLGVNSMLADPPPDTPTVPLHACTRKVLYEKE